MVKHTFSNTVNAQTRCSKHGTGYYFWSPRHEFQNTAHFETHSFYSSSITFFLPCFIFVGVGGLLRWHCCGTSSHRPPFETPFRIQNCHWYSCRIENEETQVCPAKEMKTLCLLLVAEQNKIECLTINSPRISWSHV